MFEPVSHHNSYSVYIKTLVGIKKGLYNVEAREWDSLMYDGNFYRVMPRLASLREEPVEIWLFGVVYQILIHRKL